MQRVTIIDVAAAAGVQPSTVSKALNQGRGSAEVRRRVEQAAARLGYRPNQQARGLRQSRSSSIGVLIPDLANPVFLPFIRGVEGAAHHRGYVILIADGQRSGEAESAALARFFEQGVDGLLLAGPTDRDSLRLFTEHAVPVAPPPSDAGLDLLRYWERGEAAATKEMAKRLIDDGHRRFTFVTTPQPRGAEGRHYRRGRFGTLSRAVQAVDGELHVVFVDPRNGLDQGREQLRRELVHQRPTAVVCGSHLLAPWLLLALDDAKLTVPARASVVVYGDSDWAQASRPPLSVVRRDTFAEGHDLAVHLLATIEGIDPPRQTATEATFVDRGSCARARRR